MRKFTQLVLIVLSPFVVLFLLAACAAAPSDEQIGLDMEPFLTMTEDAACADLRNQLYVIDDQFVFWAAEGQCSDASYAYILGAFHFWGRYEKIGQPRKGEVTNETQSRKTEGRISGRSGGLV
jgi:hypothetical protein